MRERIFGGVDEAGRGCVVGPLVVAGVSVDRAGAKELRRMGVRDSKLLSAKQRQKLHGKILGVCREVRLEMIPPQEIDRVVRNGGPYRKLNYLEAVYFAKVIDGLGASKAHVDASDSSPRRFGTYVTENLTRECRVLSSHRADRNHPVVSAASIVAKVTRDAEVSKLRDEHGDFGSGYPSDPDTRAFFMEYIRRGDELPDYVRKSWKTWERMRQTLLAEF